MVYIPRGGWMQAGINQYSLLSSLSGLSHANDIMDTREPIYNKSINVTSESGDPIYIVNNNTTGELNTFTKLQDLCQ
jgi:hypothetical protein